MSRGVASGGPKKARAGPKAHRLPEEFPSGLVLQDFCKQQWHLGNVIEQGGFGLIYLASSDTSKPVDKKTEFVIKIEPKNNGPLFCEMHFYQRAGKPTTIQSFISSHHLRYLGIPPFIGTGVYTYRSKEYRFLTMPRYGTDLQKLFVRNGFRFPTQVVFAVGLRMVDVLQYLHENAYVHADIKASNILLGFANGKDVTKEVYLVDYGLAYRYIVDDIHKEYREDPRKAHEGTIEFTSRDAHKGAYPSRRGDLEILGYCMLQWLCGQLPWQDNLSDPNYVQAGKERLMNNISSEVLKCLSNSESYSTECLCKYLDTVNKLRYETTPDYKHIRGILSTGLSKTGYKDEWNVDFTAKAKGTKRKSDEGLDGSSKGAPAAKKVKSPTKKLTSPVQTKQAKGRATAAKKRNPKDKLTKTPENPIVKAKPKSKSPAKKWASPKKTQTLKGTPMACAGYVPKRQLRRRVHQNQTDASIQTTPGLSKNK